MTVHDVLMSNSKTISVIELSQTQSGQFKMCQREIIQNSLFLLFDWAQSFPWLGPVPHEGTTCVSFSSTAVKFSCQRVHEHDDDDKNKTPLSLYLILTLA